MNLRKTVISLAVPALLGLAGQASASVYGVSTIEIDNLTVNVTPPNALISSFNYDLTNTAFLNGTGGANNDACSGTPASNTCGFMPAADALVYNATGSTIVAADNDFTLQGPGAGQYSRADSIVYSSQLTGSATTRQQQIAESELQSGTSASANANIQSLTGFVFSFTVNTPGSLNLAFDASAYLEASINDLTGSNQNAQANMAVLGQLSADDGSAFWNWNPNGTVDSNCLAAGNGGLATCTEVADFANIGNNTASASSNPASTILNLGNGHYEVNFDGLLVGAHTFTLRSETSTNLSRANVPEPAAIMLMGLGLVGMSFANRRRKAK